MGVLTPRLVSRKWYSWRKGHSFPDNISMDVADTASTLAVGFDADYPPTRLALYDADKLTLIDDGLVPPRDHSAVG